MGLFCFGVYGVLRLFLCVSPRASFYIGHHKVAALLAVCAGLFYLFLADTPISAIRAFLMTSIILAAVLFDRRTVTLRNVNIVFVVFVLCFPSALYQAAFQLSFVATYGIVIFHSNMKSKSWLNSHKWVRRLVYLIMTSVVAIAATLPVISYHFGVVSAWGVLANLIAIPLTAMIIMPAGICYLLFMGLGLDALIAPVFQASLSVLYWLASHIASWPLTAITIKKPPAIILPLCAMSVIMALIYRNKTRYAALLSLGALILFWIIQAVPQGVITPRGQGIGFAYLDNDTLYHTARLTPFWRDSYRRLLGDYNTTQYLRCQKGCDLTVSDGTSIVIKPQPKEGACPEAADLIITLADLSCNTAFVIVIKAQDLPILLYHDPPFGYRYKTTAPPLRPKPWHGG